ncbi:uncharacterized protein LOC118189023 [Stegodyphus dumicola]|uniref:uncharacterized protein LOC118189023 n=1 Tax=Stegodyphus dumicola TaxID=202533 RepID=UPI0015A9C850|nr:uncharacterized protein LOC118189023 [Stegodyphus dumicola]XP_035215446.1 uncharacterized protein LOC118189023 [Stegodyphus dumicola]XP_035215447.1 uncharacterized protein LOC118189023 [Stegodyphus dumicola]XP_035215448.1 uncharacterized protein LOC118189023 [Stegodyphus dumicola]
MEKNTRDVAKFHRYVRYWKPQYEVWPFVYGDEIASTMSIGSSIYIIHFFRKQLKIRQYGRLTCYTPVVGLASFFTYALQSIYVTEDILMEKSCPLCVSLRASLGHVAFGVVYPMILAPIIGFFLADKLLTYPVPSLTRAPKETLNVWLRLVKKNTRAFSILAALHFAGAMFITYQKEKSYFELKLKSQPAVK